MLRDMRELKAEVLREWHLLHSEVSPKFPQFTNNHAGLDHMSDHTPPELPFDRGKLVGFDLEETRPNYSNLRELTFI